MKAGKTERHLKVVLSIGKWQIVSVNTSLVNGKLTMDIRNPGDNEPSAVQPAQCLFGKLQSDFKASLGHMTPHLKTKTKSKETANTPYVHVRVNHTKAL